jgi:hypothetical protein
LKARFPEPPAAADTGFPWQGVFPVSSHICLALKARFPEPPTAATPAMIGHVPDRPSTTGKLSVSLVQQLDCPTLIHSQLAGIKGRTKMSTKGKKNWIKLYKGHDWYLLLKLSKYILLSAQPF